VPVDSLSVSVRPLALNLSRPSAFPRVPDATNQCPPQAVGGSAASRGRNDSAHQGSSVPVSARIASHHAGRDIKWTRLMPVNRRGVDVCIMKASFETLQIKGSVRAVLGQDDRGLDVGARTLVRLTGWRTPRGCSWRVSKPRCCPLPCGRHRIRGTRVAVPGLIKVQYIDGVFQFVLDQLGRCSTGRHRSNWGNTPVEMRASRPAAADVRPNVTQDWPGRKDPG